MIRLHSVCVIFFSITGLLTKRFTSIWRRFDILYAIFGRKEKRAQQQYIRVMHDFADDIIAKRRDYLIEQQKAATGNGISHADNDDDDDDIKRSKKMVFLDILLQATIDGKPLSNDEIIEETNTFMFAVSVLTRAQAGLQTDYVENQQQQKHSTGFCLYCPTGTRHNNIRDGRTTARIVPPQTHSGQSAAGDCECVGRKC